MYFEFGGNRLDKRENGVWEATLGARPLDPGSYRYGFAVDGAPVTDPRNIETERMQVVTRSILHVPGAAFMDARDVPHGALAVRTYYSNVLKKFRRLHIYTPPAYESNQQKYPVLYLLHGANESDQSWSTVGRAGFILDNLIADGKAVPMILVMPNGHIDQTPPSIGRGGGSRTPAPLARRWLYVDGRRWSANWPTFPLNLLETSCAMSSATTGLSMGGSQTLNIASANLDRFSAIGVFSSGILGGDAAAWEKNHLAVLEDTKLKRGLRTVWFSTGSEDFLIVNSKVTVEMLKRHGFPVTFQESTGAHTWINWRKYQRLDSRSASERSAAGHGLDSWRRLHSRNTRGTAVSRRMVGGKGPHRRLGRLPARRVRFSGASMANR